MSGCDFGWVSDGGWVQPGGVSQITSSDGSLTVTSSTGPVADITALLGVPLAAPVSAPAVISTSTAPGAPPYAGAQTFMSFGSPGNLIDVPAGEYLAVISIAVEGTANNTEYWWQVFVNGVPVDVTAPPLKPASAPIGKIGSNIPLTFIVRQVFVAPISAYVDIKIARGGGSGSAIYNSGSYSFWRVA